jgi:ABC-2 type transport system ATP-binding protein
VARAVIAFHPPGDVAVADLPLPRDADLERDDRGRLVLHTAAPTRDLAPLFAWAAARGIELEGLTVSRPSLEDVYLQLTEEPR